MTRKWQSLPERGSPILIRFIVWLSLATDRRVGRILLYPICLYFILSSGLARRSSRQHLAKIMKRPPHIGQLFKHYLTFAQITLDRVFFLSGRLALFDITIRGQDAIDAQLAKNRGFVLLGAHIGSFEALRCLGTQERQIPIKIMMYPDNSQRVLSVLAALNPALAADVIPLGQPDTMLKAKQHLDSGGIIGLLGDRITRGDKTIATEFLGQTAPFPVGPLMLASMLKAPVVLFRGLYHGANRYDVHFELLGETIAVSREERQRDLSQWITRYVAYIDRSCRLAPYNWSTFYDFWQVHQDMA